MLSRRPVAGRLLGPRDGTDPRPVGRGRRGDGPVRKRMRVSG
ncbi:hypothetical protein GDI0903 [Gluconacetobacter diazotrophicus PA1 5]|uniref:Uncharacterized protein n=1 Tax=Gluconacetobacter diazotrophicus (strain ATCC 49037 / DSM 5601 / CCUG 37298 / CIP 103539 / LMG 7603 / PAl5) TaxID=272568 RepID=A9HBR1_GLUDA|nr:hypothetical protein GDI0903 [Gluconacetobacter diazotrophicus PA1 5]